MGMTDHKKIKVGSVVILKGKKYKKQINKIGIVTNILTPNKFLVFISPKKTLVVKSSFLKIFRKSLNLRYGEILFKYLRNKLLQGKIIYTLENLERYNI